MGSIAFAEEMKMVGHETEGVKPEGVTRRKRNQVTQCHVAKRGINEVWGPIVSTDRDEIDSITDVIRGSKSDILPVEWHVQQSNISPVPRFRPFPL